MTQSLNDAMTQSSPTRARWTILSFVFLISVVTVVDRVNISVAAKYIMPEYGLSQVQMGTIFSAFIVGYTLSFIPGGWLGDRFGPRRVLTGALLAWSFLTVVTAWAGDIFLASLFGVVGSFLCIRFLFGMGEGPAYPNTNRLAAHWFPHGQGACGYSNRPAPDRRPSRRHYRPDALPTSGGAVWLDGGVRVPGRRSATRCRHLRLRASRETAGCTYGLHSFPRKHTLCTI